MKRLFNSGIALKGILIAFFMAPALGFSQQFPGADENIPFLITFGKEAPTSWGDDDYSQTFFIAIPKDQVDPIYIRVFDPDCGGQNDESKAGFNTKTKFSVYGGKEAYSHPDAKSHNPIGKYNSGILLDSKTFSVNATYDNEWYTFGPFNPSEGEWAPELNAYVFKVIADGIAGDDGNVYKYFVTTKPDRNLAVEGANAFTYEYTFRLPNERSKCHIYPFIDDKVVSVQQYNFDWDGDGIIRIVSVARKGEMVNMSTDDDWGLSKHPISDREKNTSLDIQLIKSNSVNNNNVVFRITNQYGETLPFYSIPIGGKPVYKAIINSEPIKR